MRLRDAHALHGRLELERRGHDTGLVVPDLDLVDNVSRAGKLPLGVLGGTDLVLGEFGLFAAANKGNVRGGAEHFCAADAAAEVCGKASDRHQESGLLRAIPRATFCSHVLDEKTRKPDSRAAEKQEESVLRETERTKGPVSESRIGRVFILVVSGYLKARGWGADPGLSVDM
jgi:hypothetical protein